MIPPFFRAAFQQRYLLTVEVAEIVFKIRKSFSKLSVEVIKIYIKFQPKSDAGLKEALLWAITALPALGKSQGGSIRLEAD